MFCFMWLGLLNANRVKSKIDFCVCRNALFHDESRPISSSFSSSSKLFKIKQRGGLMTPSHGVFIIQTGEIAFRALFDGF